MNATNILAKVICISGTIAGLFFVFSGGGLQVAAGGCIILLLAQILDRLTPVAN